MGESAAKEINSAGFVTLPRDLKVEVKGCPQDWQKMTTLSQQGHSLSLKEPAGSSPSLHFGAIVESHIVLVSGIAVEVEAYFGLTAAYAGLVLGDWQDGRAELVSPSGDCSVTVTAP